MNTDTDILATFNLNLLGYVTSTNFSSALTRPVHLLYVHLLYGGGRLVTSWGQQMKTSPQLAKHTHNTIHEHWTHTAPVHNVGGTNRSGTEVTTRRRTGFIVHGVFSQQSSTHHAPRSSPKFLKSKIPRVPLQSFTTRHHRGTEHHSPPHTTNHHQSILAAPPETFLTGRNGPRRAANSAVEQRWRVRWGPGFDTPAPRRVMPAQTWPTSARGVPVTSIVGLATDGPPSNRRGSLSRGAVLI